MKAALIALVVIVVIVAAFFWWGRGKKRPQVAIPPPLSALDSSMVESASRAVALAKSKGVTFDYSLDSVPRVDFVLGDVRKDWIKTRSQADLGALSVIFGAYLGEVIRRSDSKVHWGKDHPKFGANIYPLFWGDGDACSFPLAWCQKRLENGESDSVMFKFQAMEAERKNQPSSGK